jgi:flagellar assembly protein FliH
VFLHPQDYAALRAEFDADGLFKGCRFIADARIARGGCRVETAQGEVDATLATRWDRALAAVGMTGVDLDIEAPEHGGPAAPDARTGDA